MTPAPGKKTVLRVGLTGGIGAGKSLALLEFSRLGAVTVSSDQIARELSRPGGPIYRRAVAAFGAEVLRPGGSLDRARLAKIAFSNRRARRRLERAAHPLIIRETQRRLRLAPVGSVAVADVPLLFETGGQGRFDLTLLVAAPKAVRARRVMARDGASARETRRRMAAQWSQERKIRLADAVIQNARSRREFLTEISRYYKALELIVGNRPIF
ncbi:MAG: dephospho-CoA kinase [Elusimicrobiota bacterium]